MRIKDTEGPCVACRAWSEETADRLIYRLARLAPQRPPSDRLIIARLCNDHATRFYQMFRALQQLGLCDVI